MENIEFKNIFVSKYQATSKTNKLYKQKKCILNLTIIELE